MRQETAQAKMDFAILALASKTGPRGIDVRSLRLDCLDSTSRTLTLEQHKTKVTIGKRDAGI
ncbi:MAG: hypothetical protein PHI83_07475 [Sphaerochaetaceae bacterium]|nr:hypothetical protein [Sphaerochaetaceae bacterium]